MRDDGDDVFGMAVGFFGASTFRDAFRFTCPGALPGSAGCGPLDTASIAGFPPPGTNDGATGASNDGSFTYIELLHPLDSTDDLHDFSLSPGKTVGFQLKLRLFNLSLPFDSYADTRVPAGSFGDIVIASPIVRAAIDIRPGTFPNSINPRARGTIPVAILTTDTFDATTLDVSTVLFGATGTEAAPVQAGLEDVDGDLDTDVILFFKTQVTGIQCGDTSASLTGKTFGGREIDGADSINTVGCK